ncbi:dead box RNA helicase [Naegleria gruberi]|uniref:ATP-dependent RNA helicase n=1 Tax=Naegleria gruberi TaxID=5762 RepID=D2UY02_NAEGR|nr:dead box RNA helicase [Naegleria gruberi]EFC50712.1 dead box RNA helicase [Naegleria gruberi]|eukprot:XP_002683456.1 dead box RNA helicase [Naegleria gruberi strain NEG-M]
MPRSTRLTPVEKLKKENEEVEILKQKVIELTPPKGINPLAKTSTKSSVALPSQFSKFLELPISQYSKDALKKAGFVTMKDIQKASILHALGGRDILGAARTGSGKTLAFVLPVLELLYRKRWGKLDGLGALILSPNRELAQQIFEVLKLCGRYHHFSAGLLVGGTKNLKEEKEHICNMNILVATPGRLLQHMDETAGFICSNLQVLVLDEADRLLELGFRNELNSILDGLPKSRQTLLFSATQTRDIKDLARLSLSKTNTEYISVHESEPVPKQLTQHYIECQLEDKIDILFSFLKSHQNKKVIVFSSTVKQVSFLHTVFKHLPLSVKMFKLAGRMSQGSRREMFEGFTSAKAAVLFATDIAARGLDFPRVDFVLQLDAPVSKAFYIHRMGRTARNDADGKSVVVVTPQEKPLLTFLFDKDSLETGSLKEMKINPEKIVTIRAQLAALLSHDTNLKQAAVKYFQTYLKHVYKHYGYDIDFKALNLDAFAVKLGLAIKPVLILNPSDRVKKEVRLNMTEDDAEDDQSSDDDSDEMDSSDSSDSESDVTTENGKIQKGDEEEQPEVDYDSAEGEENPRNEESDEEEDVKIQNMIDSIPVDDADDDIQYQVEYDPNAVSSDSDDSDDDSDDSDSEKDLENEPEEGEEKKKKKLSKIDKFMQKKAELDKIVIGEEVTADDDFFYMKRENHKLDEKDNVPLYVNKKKFMQKIDGKKHIIFNKEGGKISKLESVLSELKNTNLSNLTNDRSEFLNEIKTRMKKTASTDKEQDKERLKNQKEITKKREKELEELRRKADLLEEDPFDYQRVVKANTPNTSTSALPDEEDVDESYEDFVNAMEQPEQKVSTTQRFKEKAEHDKQVKEKADEKKRKFDQLMATQSNLPTIVPKKKKQTVGLDEAEEMALKLLENKL